MRADQLRNHSCEEKDCPGARRLHQTTAAVGAALRPSTPTCGSDALSAGGYCRHCDAMQGLGAAAPSVTPGSDDSVERQTSTTPSSLSAGQILSRLYLGAALPLPFTNYCRI